MNNAKPTKLVVLGLIGILLPVFIEGCNNNSSTPLNDDDISFNDKESIKPIIYEEVKTILLDTLAFLMMN